MEDRRFRVALSLLEELDKVREHSERGGHDTLQIGCYCWKPGSNKSDPTACLWCRLAVFMAQHRSVER